MPPQMGPGNRNARFKEKSKPKDMKGAIKRLLSYIGEDKYKVVIAIICVLLSSGANLAGTYMLRPVIDNLSAETFSAVPKLTLLIIGLCQMALIYAIGVTASFLQARIMIKVSQNTLKRIRNDLFRKLQMFRAVSAL